MFEIPQDSRRIPVRFSEGFQQQPLKLLRLAIASAFQVTYSKRYADILQIMYICEGH